MFSHGPMSGARGPRVLLGTYSHTFKVQNWGQGAMAPMVPPGSATESLVQLLLDSWGCRKLPFFGSRGLVPL